MPSARVDTAEGRGVGLDRLGRGPSDEATVGGANRKGRGKHFAAFLFPLQNGVASEVINASPATVCGACGDLLAGGRPDFFEAGASQLLRVLPASARLEPGQRPGRQALGFLRGRRSQRAMRHPSTLRPGFRAASSRSLGRARTTRRNSLLISPFVICR